MAKITIGFDSSRRYEVVYAYNAVEGVLKGYGYVMQVITVPGDNAAAPAVNAETPSDDQPAAPVEPAAPDAPAEPSAEPTADEQVAPVDPAVPVETPAQ